jgi:hypothetical protein
VHGHIHAAQDDQRLEFLLSGAGAGFGAGLLPPCGRVGAGAAPPLLPDGGGIEPLPEPLFKVP